MTHERVTAPKPALMTPKVIHETHLPGASEESVFDATEVVAEDVVDDVVEDVSEHVIEDAVDEDAVEDAAEQLVEDVVEEPTNAN